MHFLLGFLFVLLISSVEASAQVTNEICTDLHKHACIDGKIEDGTGFTVSVNPNEESVNSAHTLNTIDNFFQANTQLLRQQAGLKLRLTCNNGRGENLENSNICDSEIKQKIIELVGRRQTEGTKGIYNVDELIFMEESGFLKLINEVQFGKSINVDIKQQEAKVEKLFPQVRQAIIDKIKNSPLEPDKKAFIIDRLNRVENRGTDCGKYFEGYDRAFLPKAFYNPETNDFLMCRNVLNQVNSEFAIITIMAHEISHSIDPCQLKMADSNQFGYPIVRDLNTADANSTFANVITCLRSPLSVAAKNKTTMALENNQITESSAKFYGYNYCSNADQIGESFSDWMASEVLTDVIAQNHPNLTREQWRNGYRNTVRAKCDQAHLDLNGKFDSHPEVKERFNSIVLANKQNRKKMGCDNINYNKKQCSLTESITDPAHLSQPPPPIKTLPIDKQGTQN